MGKESSFLCQMSRSFLQNLGVFCGLLWCVFFNAQKRDWILQDFKTQKEFKVKDSLSAVRFLDSLANHNFYFTKVVDVQQNERQNRILFDKGENYNQAEVYFNEGIVKDLSFPQKLFTKNLDSLRYSINQYYSNQGFTFSRVKTKYLGLVNSLPKVEISVETNERRNVDAILVKGYEKVPRQFIKNLEKEYLGKAYDSEKLIRLNQRLQNHQFVRLEKPPQTLFTKDSTQVYLFLQKKKSNTFDGIIGFGNNESEKFSFNGTLNLGFKNMFNGFEDVSLFWQRNPDRGQTFDLKASIPYLFQSNIGMEMQLNVFRQDSTFANVKIHPGIFYHMSSKQRIGLRGNFEISSVLDEMYTSARDFSRSGIGLWYEFQQPTDIELFLYDTKIRVEGDFLKTTYDDDLSSVSMFQYFASAEKNFRLRGNHFLNIKAESAMLNSPADLSVNELYRIGGWNSLRGFNEKSLLANFYAYAGAEYRYLVNQQAFFDVFAQYGTLQNASITIDPKFYSLGFGFNFFLPIGLMSFQISNGTQVGEQFRFKDTKIHWGIVSRF